jgi:hypothetical protein
MPPAESRKSQTIRHATRPYSLEVGVVGASRMVVRDVLRGWPIERDPGRRCLELPEPPTTSRLH